MRKLAIYNLQHLCLYIKQIELEAQLALNQVIETSSDEDFLQLPACDFVEEAIQSVLFSFKEKLKCISDNIDQGD